MKTTCNKPSDKQITIDVQSGPVCGTIACMKSILAHLPCEEFEYNQLNELYGAALRLQHRIVFNEPR